MTACPGQFACMHAAMLQWPSHHTQLRARHCRSPFRRPSLSLSRPREEAKHTFFFREANAASALSLHHSFTIAVSHHCPTPIADEPNRRFLSSRVPELFSKPCSDPVPDRQEPKPPSSYPAAERLPLTALTDHSPAPSTPATASLGHPAAHRSVLRLPRPRHRPSAIVPHRLSSAAMEPLV
jgi:hypothetical protein